MTLEIHPIPAFEDNYIWIFTDAQNKRACVVDPGDAQPVLEYLKTHELTLTDILITHHHPDHVGGVTTLISEYSPRVVGPQSSNIKGIDTYVSEGMQIQVFDTEFSVLEVPGHTLDHIAYFSKSQEQPFLFCGDTLFAAGCGRLFEGTPEMMHSSLAKLSVLPAETAVHCTHEYTMANLNFANAANPNNQVLQDRTKSEQEKRNRNEPTLPSSIKLELLTNPFLRCRDEDVQRTVAKSLNLKLDSEVQTFAALRKWKDNF